MQRLLIRTVLAGIATATALLVVLFARERPVVAVSGGLIRGVMQLDGTALFRSVPFAQPPVGELRWKPPAPLAPWSGVRDVSDDAPPCLQSPHGWNDSLAVQSSEDCLYLQIRTPRLDPNAKLPVMVWIHGGANQAGAGRGYSRSPIVKRGVVLVMLQYRLGVFGFISHPELSAESEHAASGNYALLDQIAALQWVRDNIAAFGGDPANVTIFGQSAGAQDVGLLMLTPLSAGLFDKAVAQSGTATFGASPRSLKENEELGLQLARHANAANLRELRAKSGQELLIAAQSLSQPALHDPSSLWLRAVVDGWVIRDAPMTTLAAGQQHRVPLIIGNNSSEFPLHGGPDRTHAEIARAFGAHADRAVQLYGIAAAAPISHEISTQLATDLTFRCPALSVAQMHVAHGLSAWHYEFGLNESDEPVQHSAELPFVFYDKRVTSSGQPRASLLDYWVQFARTGDPNSEQLADWPMFGAGRASLTVTSKGVAVVRDLRSELCSLLQPS
jgi:para-nitrobenzyl esterase